MGDFGKILKQWENQSGRREPPPVANDRSPGRSPEHDAPPAVPSMDEEWLDRYPAPPDPEERDEPASSPEPRKRAVDLPIDARIDLHGYRLDEAVRETTAFLEESLSLGLRKILVIHGKGRNGEGVLRREIRRLLESHPRTGEMGYAKGSQGGRGALWVVLRSGPK